TGATWGVYGSNPSTTAGAAAVYGTATGASGAVYGVYGDSASATGFGVYGTNTASAGVGVQGVANTGAGVGVKGTTSSTTNNAIGVSGVTVAVTGQTNGVSGWTNSTTYYAMGVYGGAGGATGVTFGLYGQTFSATAQAAGVFGGTTTATGANAGVYGYNHSTTGYGGFFTNDNGGYALVTGSGNVGIGTNAPTNKLYVVGNIQIDSGFAYVSGTGVTQHLLAASGANYGTIQNDAAGTWSFGYKSNNSMALGTPVLSWNSSGNVGIGTTTPATTLDVNGGFATRATTAALTADNTLIDVTGISYLRLNSNNGTGTNRTFCLKGGVDGQRLVIMDRDGNDAELIDGAQPCAGSPQTVDLNNGTFRPGTAGDGIELIYDGTAATWWEINRN
ncbi:MAG: hypothetical protein L0Z50_17370, partial [Verrucomicrobiales bacterium]|nr:hypothetical protein [Verrucomicrobiales bacterium]